MSLKAIRVIGGFTAFVLSFGIAGCSRSSQWNSAASQCQNVVLSYKDQILSIVEAKDAQRAEALSTEVDAKLLAIVSALPSLSITTKETPFEVLETMPVEEVEIKNGGRSIELAIPVDVRITGKIPDLGYVVIQARDSHDVTLSTYTEFMPEAFPTPTSLNDKLRFKLFVDWDFQDASHAGIDHLVLSIMP